MTLMTRSFSLPVLSYGVPREGEPVQLFDVGMRVDVGAEVERPDLAAIDATLALLKETVAPFLTQSWEGRLLCGRADERARASARAHAGDLPRSYVVLSCDFTAESLAPFVLKRLAFEPTYRRRVNVVSVQVSLDPGTSYRAQVADQSAQTVTGDAACQALGPNHPTAFARSATKWNLTTAAKKASGVTS